MMQAAEGNPAARLVVMFDAQAQLTLMAATKGGQVVNWTLLAPMTEEATRACLAGEVERGNASEDEIVYLLMAEIASEHLRLN
jgi:hypothetical protein